MSQRFLLRTLCLIITICFFHWPFVFSAEPSANGQLSNRVVLSSRYSQCIYPVWENGKIRLINFRGEYINNHSYDIPRVKTPLCFTSNGEPQFFLERDSNLFRINSIGQEYFIAMPEGYSFWRYLGNDRFLIQKTNQDRTLYRIYSASKNQFLSGDFIWFRHSDDLVFVCFDMEAWWKYEDYYDKGIGNEPETMPNISVVNLRDGTIIPCPDNFMPMAGIGRGLLRGYTIDSKGIPVVEQILDYHGNVALKLPENHSVADVSFHEDRLVTLDRGKYYIVECNGDIIYETIGQIFGFSSGLAKVKVVRDDIVAHQNSFANERIGYVNRFGEEIIPFQYCRGTNFHNGLAFVQDMEEKYHLINTFGDVILCDYFSNFPKDILAQNSNMNFDSLLRNGVSYLREIIYDPDNRGFYCVLVNFDGTVIWKSSSRQEKNEDADSMWNCYNFLDN